MSNKKQSSIEWFYDNILTHCVFDQLRQMITINPDVYIELKKQAKAMHKEEIEEAWDDGCYQSSDFPKTSDAEKYYNATFGGQDNE